MRTDESFDALIQTLNTVAIGLVAVALLAILWVSCGSDPGAIEYSTDRVVIRPADRPPV